ncbi:MATE family efflux transporter [Paraburkholderia caribensis]|uniref:MATE family efflux transporter n=1 Tax=Paraburkholderia caribensis TaxID=75105 RepID=A0ABV0DQR9_9BURK|nr:MATE family efflux transporter [Paraburkholderia caribensis]MCO4876572.1 MATE family efflux transporter [Paraburkholderia caribensis]
MTTTQSTRTRTADVAGPSQPANPDPRDVAKMQAREAMLHGPIFKTMMRLAVPTIGVLVAQTLVNVAETFYVSRLGTEALIGVALVFPVWMLMTMMSAGGIGGGVASAVARATGAGRHEDANALVLHTVVIAVAFGLLFSGLLIGFGSPLYKALGGTGEALHSALLYSNFIFLSAVPIWVVNVLSAALRGIGNVRVPAWVTFVGAAVLVPLSPLLIFGIGPIRGFGVAGAGIAVTLYYCVAAVAMLFYMASGRSGLRLSIARLRWPLFHGILKVGLLSALNTIQLNVMVLLVTAAVGRFGVDAIGGYGTASRLDYVLVPILFGLGTAILTMVGTNVGAGQIERAKKIAWLGTAVSVTFTEAVGLLVALFPWLWIGLFSHDSAILETGSLYFRIVAPFYAANGMVFALGFAAQGAGRVGWIFLAGAIRLLIAAGGGWLAVAGFGFSQAALFALVALALVSAAIVCATAALSNAIWATGNNKPGSKARPS